MMTSFSHRTYLHNGNLRRRKSSLLRSHQEMPQRSILHCVQLESNWITRIASEDINCPGHALPVPCWVPSPCFPWPCLPITRNLIGRFQDLQILRQFSFFLFLKLAELTFMDIQTTNDPLPLRTTHLSLESEEGKPSLHIHDSWWQHGIPSTEYIAAVFSAADMNQLVLISS